MILFLCGHGPRSELQSEAEREKAKEQWSASSGMIDYSMRGITKCLDAYLDRNVPEYTRASNLLYFCELKKLLRPEFIEIKGLRLPTNTLML